MFEIFGQGIKVKFWRPIPESEDDDEDEELEEAELELPEVRTGTRA